ncbi:MAG TPA: glycosyltransferase [Longimicrobiales bacterium]
MSNATPLVSFVVLSYNYARFIGDTIRSILAQEGEYPFEIIVVDDASTDNSHEVITSFSDARIRYFRHDRNQGHAATVTDGLREAQGKYVARVDSDDRYRPQFLQETIPILEAEAGVGLVYGDAAIINDEGVITALTTDVQHGGADYRGNEYVALLEKNFICAPTIIARREAWLAALPITEGLSFHDWWFTLQIARGWEFYYRDAVLADYRVHQSNYHTLIARNKTEESSILRLLNQLFSEPEKDAALERAKQDAKSRIYASHYLTLALKYFGAGMGVDARRCYLAAVKRRPAYLSNAAVVRQLAATFLGIATYQRLKSVVRRG